MAAEEAACRAAKQSNSGRDGENAFERPDAAWYPEGFMDVRPRKPGLVFVIVHGTASRNARWIRPDSKIRRRLERHFGRRGLTVSFEWSGANTDEARLTAAKALGKRIAELYEEFHAPIYLVAHSHGGNIALYSMRDPSVEAKVVGVICMATSFIQCRPRPLIPAIEKSLELLPRLIGATALGLLALMPAMEGRQAAAFHELAGWYAILLLGFISQTLWMPWYRNACDRWVKRIARSIRARSQSTIAALSLPMLPNVKMLCLSTPNDEVTKCLRLSIFLSELPFFAWRFVDRVRDLVMGLESGPSKLLAAAFHAGAGAAIAGAFAGNGRIAWLHWVGLLLIPRLAGLIVLIIAPPAILCWQLLLVITPDLPGVLSHKFGAESRFSNWFTRFTVGTAPEGPGDYAVKEIAVVAGKLDFRAPNVRTFWAATAHTKFYNNRQVLCEIMRWIYKNEESRAKLSEP